VIKREKGKLILKMVTGSIIASGIAWFVNPELMGTSSRLIHGVISGNASLLMGRLPPSVPISLILIILLICKALCNCITVGSGMSAGFTGPAVLIGMFLAMAFAHLLHVDHTSPTFYAYIATGFSGILASSMNIPLAAAVMTVEIFGLIFSIPASLAAIIGFQVNRHLTLYDFAIAGSGRK
jgi:H+/Cl- antiporter ClcA